VRAEREVGILLTVADESGWTTRVRPSWRDGMAHASFRGQSPGLCRITATGIPNGAEPVAPNTATTLVWSEERVNAELD
jgi:hypothetical protein